MVASLSRIPRSVDAGNMLHISLGMDNYLPIPTLVGYKNSAIFRPLCDKSADMLSLVPICNRGYSKR